MKIPEKNPSGREYRPRGIISPCLVVTWLILLNAFLAGGPAQAQPVPPDQSAAGDMQDQQVLTRGPVHEAFAGIITFNPEPGPVVPKAPPEAIEEVPPDQRPEGANVTWIPGYWAWDDERNDFLWISGVWRALPPGREWVPGYWGQTSGGYQWTSGYWADANANDETTYLPPPPATVETGPNIAAPADDYVWTPGCWVWVDGRYAWRPGYWVEVRPDWIWIPACYVYTPHGCVFVDGYWDYSVQRRGVMFAPVYFQAGYYERPHHYYSPSIVISLDIFSDALFCSPRRQHYYFGDYYDTRYEGAGFYASFSFGSRHRGYDPIFTHERWEHRGDRDWERHVETTYRERRENVHDRPARTWADARRYEHDNNNNDRGGNRRQLAMPIEQFARERNSPVRFQPVAQNERQTFVQRERDVQKNRDERRTLETRVVNKTTINNNIHNEFKNNNQASEPSRLKLPRSSITARQADQNSRDQAPPRPDRAAQSDSNRNAVDRQNQRDERRGSNPHQDAVQPDSRQRNVPDRNDRSTPNSDRNPSRPDRATAPDRSAVPTRSPAAPDRTATPEERRERVSPHDQTPQVRPNNQPDRNDRSTPNNDRNPSRPDRATAPDRSAVPTRSPAAPDQTVTPAERRERVSPHDQTPQVRPNNQPDRNDHSTPNYDRNSARQDRAATPDRSAVPARSPVAPDRTAVPDRTVMPQGRPNNQPDRYDHSTPNYDRNPSRQDRAAAPDRSAGSTTSPVAPDRTAVPDRTVTPQVRPNNQPDRTPHINTDNQDKNARHQTDSAVTPAIQPERQRETVMPSQRDGNTRQNIVREPSAVPAREPKANDTPRVVEQQSPARSAPVIREKAAPSQPVRDDGNKGNKPDGSNRKDQDKQP